MLSKEVERLNEAARELHEAGFRRPKTPNEWQRLARTRQSWDYDKLLRVVGPLLGVFTSANASDRAHIVSSLNPDALFVLRAFAFCVAVLAVRRQSPELIAGGLTALAVLGGSDDVRDLTCYLATLHHSAMKLGLDARRLFGDAARLASSPDLQEAMRLFPVRPPKARDLGAFRLRETLTDGKYDLVQDPW